MDNSIKTTAVFGVCCDTVTHRKTVCCALWAGGIIGTYFFKNEAGQNVTVNDRLTAMITHFFVHQLNNHEVK